MRPGGFCNDPKRFVHNDLFLLFLTSWIHRSNFNRLQSSGEARHALWICLFLNHDAEYWLKETIVFLQGLAIVRKNCATDGFFGGGRDELDAPHEDADRFR